MKKSFLLVVIFVLLAGQTIIFGQIQEKSTTFLKGYPSDIDIPEIILPEIDLRKLKKEDNEFELSGLKSLRFAKVIEVDINPESNGKWIVDEAGNKTWYLKIKSPGAFSLGVLFDHYRLPPGAELFISTLDLKNVKGAFTFKNNKANYIFPVSPVIGDELIIMYNEPAKVIFPGELHISSIAHDYKNIFDILNKSEKGYGSSGACNVNINCDNDELWQTLKHSVCKITFNGWLCSGSLINNTNNDGKPYFLTANHCIDNSFDASSAIFYFNYESPVCENVNGLLNQSISGSTIIAMPSTKSLDFTLLKLSAEPLPEYKPYYAGWNRDIADPKSVTTIHHPSGDIKKISKSYNGATTSDYGEGFTEYSHWWIDNWDEGTTEGGSSGSPLFDQNGKIIGDLTGGDASCQYNYNDYYQQFYRSWSDYPDTLNQLKYWLDPINSGEVSINGYKPFDSIPSGLKVMFNGVSAYLEWNPVNETSNVERYIVYRDSVKIDSTNYTFYNDLMVKQDSLYIYYITARLKFPLGMETMPGNSCVLNTWNLSTIPFVEDFEIGDSIPKGWYEDRSDPEVGWVFKSGGISGLVDTAYEGNYNAFFYGKNGETSKLILPKFNLNGGSNLMLSFYLNMLEFENNNHELRVLIKSSDSAPWEIIRTFTEYTTSWEHIKISLPKIDSNYTLALDGVGLDGGGICIDSITLQEDSKYTEPDILINNRVICENDSVTFTTSLSDTLDLKWYFGELAYPITAIGKGPHKVKYMTSGIKGVQLKLNNTYVKTEKDLVWVYPEPDVDFTIDNGTLTSNYNYGNQWYFESKPIEGATNQTLVVGKNGLYQVEVRSFANCFGISPEKYVVASADDDLPFDEEFEEKNFIYPNPNNGNFKINMPERLNNSSSSYKIFDIIGRLVDLGDINSENDIISVRNVSDGIYFVKIEANNKQFVQKVIIKK